MLCGRGHGIEGEECGRGFTSSSLLKIEHAEVYHTCMYEMERRDSVKKLKVAFARSMSTGCTGDEASPWPRSPYKASPYAAVPLFLFFSSIFIFFEEVSSFF